MKMLALEFSSPRRSVAVSDGATRRGTAADFGLREMKPFALLEAALREAGMHREEIECVVVGLGPGSYAGTRQAIAIAQGWQIARGVKLLGRSSAEAVAAEVLASRGGEMVSIALEVQRGELFVAEFARDDAGGPRLVRNFERLAGRQMDAALLHRLDWPPGAQPPDGVAASYPDATALLALAATRTDFVDGSALEPVYLRPVEFVKAPAPKFQAE